MSCSEAIFSKTLDKTGGRLIGITKKKYVLPENFPTHLGIALI